MEKNQKRSNAQTLLCEYRFAVWRKSALEAVPGIGQKELKACVEQMRFTHKLAQTLKGDKLLGEKLYWIIYASYLTDHHPGDIEEILSEITQKYGHIPRRTYFRLRTRAIKMMDEHLNAMAG